MPTPTTTATPTATTTVTPPATKVETTTKVKKPKHAPAFKADFKVKVTVSADAATPPVASSSSTRARRIGKGTLVDGKVKITIKKNLRVGKHQLLAKYQGSSTALPSKKKFTITIVEG